MEVKLGQVYQYYKGGYYIVTDIVQHTETGECLVVYQDEKGGRWARPYEMFTEYMDDLKCYRFEEI